MTRIMQSRSINQLSKRRSLLSPGRIGFVFGALILLLVVVFNSFIVNVLSSLVASVTNPANSVYENVPRAVLASRLKDAEEELARLRYQGLLFALEVEKNQELTELLGIPEQEVIGRGRVFIRPPHTHYDTLLVSLMSEDVAVGDLAYASGILIGQVSEVQKGVVRVTLYSSPGTTIDARVGEPSAIVVMRGLGGGSFSLEVPKEVSLEVGDSILVSQSDALVAVVQRIIDEPEQTTFRVHAASPVSGTDTRIIEFVRKLPVFEE